MTKQEIQALIDAKIAGQGSAVDAGGALPKILTEILNAAFAGANVQSDWDENDNADPSFIKNKPTIPAAQVQSDWTQADNTKVDFIKNKPTLDFVPYVDFGETLVMGEHTANELMATGAIKYSGSWFFRETSLDNTLLSWIRSAFGDVVDGIFGVWQNSRTEDTHYIIVGYWDGTSSQLGELEQ